jgi:hypothetical protein
MAGLGYGFYQYLKMVINGIAQEVQIEDTVVEWDSIDEQYWTQFTDHVLQCSNCNPQDEPCAVGNAILREWKEAKKL